jgi:predicted RNase H-like nuclease
MRYIGVDLAWSDSTRACETGVAALESDGRVVAAGWTVGVAETIAWLEQHAGGEALALVDAPSAGAESAADAADVREAGRVALRPLEGLCQLDEPRHSPSCRRNPASRAGSAWLGL